MIDKLSLNKRINELEDEILKINSDFFLNFPIKFYINEVKTYPELSNYKFTSPALNSIFMEIKNKFSFRCLALFHKIALLYFIKISIDDLKKKNITQRIFNLYQEWFNLVVNDSYSQNDEYYDCRNDYFQKDRGICSLKLIPVGGPWILEKGKIGKRFIFNGGFKQFAKGLTFFLTKMRGFKPFYALHLVDRFIERFNPSERIKCFLRIAELLELQNEIKGLYGRSWFYDPAVASISPKLAYVSQGMLENGAEDFRIGVSQFDIDNALLKSPKRRKLHKQGKYIPTAYYIIWPRQELIKWAKTDRVSNGIIN